MAPKPKLAPPPKPDTSGGVRNPGDYTGSRNPREAPQNAPGDTSGGVRNPGDYTGSRNPREGGGFSSRKAPVPGSGATTYPKPHDPEPPIPGYRSRKTTLPGLSKVPRGLKFSGLVRL